MTVKKFNIADVLSIIVGDVRKDSWSQRHIFEKSEEGLRIQAEIIKHLTGKKLPNVRPGTYSHEYSEIMRETGDAIKSQYPWAKYLLFRHGGEHAVPARVIEDKEDFVATMTEAFGAKLSLEGISRSAALKQGETHSEDARQTVGANRRGRH